MRISFFWRGIAVMAIASTVLWALPADAADKGGPNIIDELAEPTASRPNWTGPWIGAHVGYSRMNVDESVEVGPGFFLGNSFSEKEITYGAGAGYDAKLPGSMIVVGVMADIDMPNNDAVDWAGFAGVRGGILVSPSALVYALGGYTWVKGDADVFDNGLTVGAGVEAFVFKNVSMKLEYRYLDLGDERYEFEGLPASAEGDVQTIRLGLNFRF